MIKTAPFRTIFLKTYTNQNGFLKVHKEKLIFFVFLQAKGVILYALVNNAGVMRAEPEVVINTNFKGPKRVTDAFIGLIDKSEGRIVNTSSGVASVWLCNQDSKTNPRRFESTLS